MLSAALVFTFFSPETAALIHLLCFFFPIKSESGSEGEANHLTPHVSFEIKRHAHTRNFLSLEGRPKNKRGTGIEEEQQKALRRKQLYTSNFGGQMLQKLCLLLFFSHKCPFAYN